MNILTWTIILFSTLNYNVDSGVKESGQLAEKVYLHTDRKIYYSGDDIWFKAYVVDALTTRPSQNTNNLHVELLTPDSDIYQSRIVSIVNGLGNGDFILSDSIKSGIYKIRAYTNFMRNFSEEFFFNEEIVVINPAAPEERMSDSIRFVNKKIDLTFFPEGGSLVYSVTSTVAFKAVDESGKGCTVTGKVFSFSGDLIVSFGSTHLGMGSFMLQPAEGQKYYAIVKGEESEEYRFEIPKSFKSGFVLHPVIAENNNLLLKVLTNSNTLKLYPDKDLILALTTRNLITRSVNLKMTTLNNNFLIPLNDFPDGILRITLAGSDSLPLCERLVFFQKSNNIKISLSTDKTVYAPREPVKLEIGLTGDTTSNDMGYLSFSAAESGLVVDSTKSQSSIASWFLLESDVRGLVENPDYYFDCLNENRLRDLDLLLITQGWRDFQWKYDTTNYFKHEIGFSISGRLRRVLSKKPVSNAKINIGVFGESNMSFLTAVTDTLGVFKADKVNITGQSKIIVTALNNKDESEGWLFIDSAHYVPAFIPVSMNRTIFKAFSDPSYTALKQEAIVKYAVLKKYRLSDTLNVGEVFITSNKPDTHQEQKVKMGRSRYGTPDKELIITPALERYPDIFHAISGRIPGVWVTGSSVTIRGEAALVLRDGIPTKPDVILSIPVYMIDRVDILNWSPLYNISGSEGGSGANGVINFITKSGSSNNKEPKSFFHSTSFKMSGFNAARVFYSPKYDLPQETAFTPDLRNTVYWNPYITVKEGKIVSFSYFNADQKSNIRVIIEGITTNGIPVTGSIEYVVR